MIIFLGLLKDDLEADKAGLPAELINIPENLLAQLAKEAGEDRGKQIETIDKILENLEALVTPTLMTRQLDKTREQMKKTVRPRERYLEPTRRAPQRRPPLSLPPR